MRTWTSGEKQKRDVKSGVERIDLRHFTSGPVVNERGGEVNEADINP